jgi:hypothetical protein
MPNKAKGGYMKSDFNNGFPEKGTLTEEQVKDIEAVLEKDLTGIGINAVLLADKAGNIIAKHDEGCSMISVLWQHSDRQIA